MLFLTPKHTFLDEWKIILEEKYFVEFLDYEIFFHSSSFQFEGVVDNA